jgi:hypothetical protein
VAAYDRRKGRQKRDKETERHRRETGRQIRTEETHIDKGTVRMGGETGDIEKRWRDRETERKEGETRDR